MRMSRISILFLVIVFLSSLFPIGGEVLASSDDFTIIVLPDTQFYSESYQAIFTAQTQWIVGNSSLCWHFVQLRIASVWTPILLDASVLVDVTTPTSTVSVTDRFPKYSYC